MQAALVICAAFAINVNRWPAVVGECAGCECEIQSANVTGCGNVNGTLKNDFVSLSFSTPAWMTIGQLELEKITGTLTRWLKAAWNDGVTLKVNVLRSQQNDTLVNVRFGAAHSPVAGGDEVGRTFGIRRRMQLFLLLPISFKLGIIMTLLLVLTAMSLKTLLIGLVILLLLLNHTHGHAKLWGASKVHEVSDLQKNIHIHVHTLPQNHHPHVQWHDPITQPVVYSA